MPMARTRRRRSKVPSSTVQVKTAFLVLWTALDHVETLRGWYPGRRQTLTSHGLTPGLCLRIIPPGESMVVVGAGKAVP